VEKSREPARGVLLVLMTIGRNQSRPRLVVGFLFETIFFRAAAGEARSDFRLYLAFIRVYCNGIHGYHTVYP